jgi:hypothetical protein
MMVFDFAKLGLRRLNEILVIEVDEIIAIFFIHFLFFYFLGLTFTVTRGQYWRVVVKQKDKSLDNTNN